MSRPQKNRTIKLPSLNGKNHWIIKTTIRHELHLIITYLYGPLRSIQMESKHPLFFFNE